MSLALTNRLLCALTVILNNSVSPAAKLQPVSLPVTVIVSQVAVVESPVALPQRVVDEVERYVATVTLSLEFSRLAINCSVVSLAKALKSLGSV